MDVITLDKKVGEKRHDWEEALRDFQTDLRDIDNGRNISLETLESDFRDLKKMQTKLETALFSTP
ncbi:MAG: hypothetical protein NTU58_03610 [Candidatus Nealsonbacteria bacterium]|nr:hypothetical protein [Candidatus Nealsonbacteria bacterium]